MAACAILTRPSSHGPPPAPPMTGMPTARVTSGPATGPELVKSSSAAPALLEPLRVGDQLVRHAAGTRAPGASIAS